MACSNCFNGCADIVSDQCVKYTGIPIPGLGIATGDPLLVVENQIINKILELMTGEGIIPVINSADLCSIVSAFLPSTGDITLNDVISALLRTVCALDTRLKAVESTLVTLNADYVIGCLSGVSITSDTHEIVQATITKLCQVDTALTLLTSNILVNYVLISEIDDYIASYISGTPAAVLLNSKMIPYTAIPYFGPLNVFDITGAGLGDWIKIYLCNGQNLTPDLRGRALVGATTMGTNVYTDGNATNPAVSGNPTYSGSSPFTKVGANLALLTTPNQLPPHIHSGLIDSAGDHVHTISQIRSYTNVQGTNGLYDRSNTYTNAALSTDPGGAHTHTITIGSTGASEGHANIQPVHSTNYIIYIP